MKDSLEELRREIDGIDDSLLPLLQRRMDIVSRVAKLKREKNLAILDSSREQQIIDRLTSRAEESYRGQISLLMRTMFALSKGQQRTMLLGGEDELFPEPREPVKGELTCAYQGVPGAWSEHAALRIFPEAKRVAVDYFEDVFVSVKEGRADYGVVAIENSLTGAIGETYDLLRRYGCYIVGRTVVPILHCLLAPEGTKLSDIREVYSHPQGFQQCRTFLRDRSWDLRDCGNTAIAAEIAAKDPSGKTAAIGSRRAGELAGLAVIAPDVMDSAMNRTSFVVISPKPEYDDTCELVSIAFSSPHRSGALCECLLPFLAQGINLTRIESRPGASGNYRFFAELEGNVRGERMQAALRQISSVTEYFEVVGCYKSL